MVVSSFSILFSLMHILIMYIIYFFLGVTFVFTSLFSEFIYIRDLYVNKKLLNKIVNQIVMGDHLIITMPTPSKQPNIGINSHNMKDLLYFFTLNGRFKKNFANKGSACAEGAAHIKLTLTFLISIVISLSN